MTGLHIYDNGGGIYVYTGIDRGGKTSADEINSLIGTMTDKPFTLAAFEVNDWNADLSPWEAPAVLGKRAQPFSGGGEKMLLRLKNEIIPEAERDTAAEKRFIAGYSLSGLFSLWAFYESGLFDGAASCSGSLWFPRWTDYASSCGAPENSIVYLSLGDKEERTKNSVMSSVGICTRRQDELLENDKNVRKHILEYNAGGHFRDAGLRAAKGIAWLIGNAEDLI